jgi:hypothetical protein
MLWLCVIRLLYFVCFMHFINSTISKEIIVSNIHDERILHAPAQRPSANISSVDLYPFGTYPSLFKEVVKPNQTLGPGKPTIDLARP